MKNKTPLLSFIVALISLILLTVLNNNSRVDKPSHGNTTIDTVIVVKSDTVYDTVHVTKYYPKPITVEVLKTDTITKDTVLVVEKKLYTDTIATPTDTICLASEVEGIGIRMNYLKAYLKKGTINTHTTETITITKKKGGFRLAPQVGVGYGLTNKKADIYIGFGLTYVF